jgi:hypothetical protein
MSVSKLHCMIAENSALSLKIFRVLTFLNSPAFASIEPAGCRSLEAIWRVLIYWLSSRDWSDAIKSILDIASLHVTLDKFCLATVFVLSWEKIRSPSRVTKYLSNYQSRSYLLQYSSPASWSAQLMPSLRLNFLHRHCRGSSRKEKAIWRLDQKYLWN